MPGPKLALVLLALLGIVGCGKPDRAAPLEAKASAVLRSAELPESAPDAIVDLVVPNDRSALLVLGRGSRPIVYLHGMCSEPRADLEAWSASVRELGTILALEGDLPCRERGGRTFTHAVPALDARIDAALVAAMERTGAPLERRSLVLVGESLGALRATALAARYPEKYPRLVLVGGPTTPSPRELDGVIAVALLAGEKEPQSKMREGAAVLAAAGTPARFWELEGASHGSYGPNGGATMAEAIAFVAER